MGRVDEQLGVRPRRPGVDLARLIDGTARAGIEACMHSVVAPGDKVLVPIFGEGNATTGFRELQFTAALRHDDYSDVGGTTNPKFGFRWKPIDACREHRLHRGRDADTLDRT